MADTLAVKVNGAEVLDRQLAFRVKKEQYGIIALASATDPYIRLDEKLQMDAEIPGTHPEASFSPLDDNER